jgi:tetratricopeptide (TPR) repeat protein
MKWCLPLVAAMALAIFASGCSRLKEIARPLTRSFTRPSAVFPRLDTARDQFNYAAEIDQNTLAGPREKGVERLQRVVAAYQMVLDHFPDDPIYTPLAEAGIGNCYFRMKEYRKAIRTFKRLEARYPNFSFIHAQAEWKIGQSLDSLGNSFEAKIHYKRCIDTFGRSKNEQIQLIVALCKQYYMPPSFPGKTTRR